MGDNVEMDTYPFKWEQISSESHRAQVIGGWIVSLACYSGASNPVAVSMVFIPDAFHEWKIQKPEGT